MALVLALAEKKEACYKARGLLQVGNNLSLVFFFDFLGAFNSTSTPPFLTHILVMYM